MAVSIVFVGLAIFLAQFSDNNGQVFRSDPYHQPAGPWNGKLAIDTAFVNITSSNNVVLFDVTGVSDNCYKCDYQLLRGNFDDHHTYIIVDTTHVFKLNITSKTGSYCLINRSFVENGQYLIDMGKLNSLKCRLSVLHEDREDKTYRPIFIAFGVFAGAAVLWYLLTLVCSKYHLGTRLGIFSDHESLINADLGSPNHLNRSVVSPSGDSDELKPEQPVKQKRVRSLDTFRGIALTIMIFVNNGGGGYYFFHHSRWNGLTVADLVFPWFMWIMGVSITLSFRSLRRRQTKTLHIVIKIIRRTIILFLLGVFTSNMGDLDIYRVPGVLQRFAACYLVVSLVQVLAGPTEDSQPTGAWWDAIRDVVALWTQWLFMLAVLISYIIVTYAVKIDDCPTGYTGPGGIGRGYPSAYNCTGGVASKIDQKIFGNHVYQGGTFKHLYRVSMYHDPEGALGTLTSIFLVFLGVQAGYILFTYSSHKARIARWMVWSVILGCLAIGLSGGTKNEGLVPINKNLWSVSFIFATGAMAFILLSVCYVMVDVYGIWSGSPFTYPGMNSIVIYCGSELLGQHFPFSWILDPYHTHGDELLMNIVGTGCWMLVAFYMYWIDFFVKI